MLHCEDSDHELCKEAAKRLKKPNQKTYSQEEVMKIFGITEQDLENVEADLD